MSAEDAMDRSEVVARLTAMRANENDELPLSTYEEETLDAAIALLAAPSVDGTLREALEKIASLKPEPYAFPADWEQQIEACEECKRWRGHPIQAGICDRHRRPLWDREKYDADELRAIGYRAKDIARVALLASAPEPREPDGWVDAAVFAVWRSKRGTMLPVHCDIAYADEPLPVYIGAQPAPSEEVDRG